jgi:hypothetical protein
MADAWNRPSRAAEYAMIDQQCESLTEREVMVGEFEEAPAEPTRRTASLKTEN